jgi:hypothetical protein
MNDVCNSFVRKLKRIKVKYVFQSWRRVRWTRLLSLQFPFKRWRRYADSCLTKKDKMEAADSHYMEYTKRRVITRLMRHAHNCESARIFQLNKDTFLERSRLQYERCMKLRVFSALKHRVGLKHDLQARGILAQKKLAIIKKRHAVKSIRLFVKKVKRLKQAFKSVYHKAKLRSMRQFFSRVVKFTSLHRMKRLQKAKGNQWDIRRVLKYHWSMYRDAFQDAMKHKKALNFHNLRYKKKVVDYWRFWKQQHVYKAKQVQVARAHFELRKLTVSVQCWRGWMLEDRICFTASVMIMLKSWRRYTESQLAMRDRVEVWTSQKGVYTIGILPKTFYAWSSEYMDYVHYQQHLEWMHSIATFYSNRLVLKKFFFLWRPPVAKLILKRWSHWARTEHQTNGGITKRFHFCMRKTDASIMKRTLLGWHSLFVRRTSLKKRVREVKQLCLVGIRQAYRTKLMAHIYWKRFTLRKVLFAWNRVWTDVRQKVLGLVMKNIVSGIFHSWAEYVSSEKEARLIDDLRASRTAGTVAKHMDSILEVKHLIAYFHSDCELVLKLITSLHLLSETWYTLPSRPPLHLEGAVSPLLGGVVYLPWWMSHQVAMG